MNDEQRVLFKQLQLAGLGVVLILFGFFAHQKNISYIGIGVAIFGVIRYFIIKSLLDKAE